MKRTLLDLVQSILNDMDSDEVNSIDDTIESQQVAIIVKDCYLELMDGKVWKHLQRLIQLDSLADSTKPTYLKVPETIKELTFFNYDKRKLFTDNIRMEEVKYLYPDQFLRVTATRNLSDNTENITDFSGSNIIVFNDRAPQYWTSFDDEYIVCDSYNKDIEDTLRSSKTQVLAYMEPTWVHLDNAVPDLPSQAFSLLLEESKATAMIKLKQIVDQKAEQKSKRQRQKMSRENWQAHGGVRYDNYGRRRVK
jgi:hypothetical protein